MHSYKYKVVKLDKGDNKTLERKLNSLASERWELEKILNSCEKETLNLVFKRKKGLI